MANLLPDRERRAGLLQGALAVLAAGAAIVALVGGVPLAALLAGVVALVLGMQSRRSGHITLTALELDQLRQAELALAGAEDTHEAARELAEHAISLLGARAAVVLIEGIGDTVRVAVGPRRTEDVYGSGSRMRLLDDAGVPCGSIAVSARADGRPYTARDERILDALAERVSTTLHQLSLLTDVSTERRTLADLVGSSSDGIFSVGSDLRVKSWNPAMADITGVPAEHAIGEHLSASFRPTFADGSSATGSADPGRRGEPTQELVQLEVDGEQRWLTCSYAPLADGGYVVVARDDTERKKLEDDKDGWIAQVSHELRTPLTPIKGFLHTLVKRDDQMSTDDRSKIYEVMLREEQRLENLVDSLLRSTQLDQGGLVIDRQPVDWASLIEHQVDLARRQDPARTIDVRVGADLPRASTDADLATVVLTNLLSNATKYAEGGTPIEITAEVVGGDIVTSVIDHGAGIPRSDRDRIFNKFTRLGNHLTRRQQGVGLGLHIVRQSLERLGGRVWIDETPGGGATFRFTLPAAAPRSSVDTSDRRRTPLRVRGSRPSGR